MKRKLDLTAKPTSKLTLKHTLFYTVAGLGIATILFTGAFLYFNLGNSEEVKAIANPDYISHVNKNSSWNDASTWHNVPHWKTSVPQVGTYWTMNLNGTVTYEPANPNNIFNHSPSGSVMDLKDTLIIKSDANFGNVINVLETGVLIIYGDLNIQAGNLLRNNGRVVVTGNLTTDDNSTLTNNASSKNGFYVFGETGTRTDNREYGKNIKNEANLASNDPSLYKFVGNGGSLLPIVLADFQAAVTGIQTVQVEWSTYSEKNNDFFTVERSADGKNFEVLTTVSGAGNSNKKSHYSIEDKLPLPGYNYYRLKQTDFNGDFEYFKIVGVNNAQTKAGLSAKSIHINDAWPNPFTDRLNISLEAERGGEAKIFVRNIFGEVVHQASLQLNDGENKYAFDQTESLKSGVYFVTIDSNGKKFTQKVIKI